MKVGITCFVSDQSLLATWMFSVLFNGFDFCWLCPLNILCSMVSFLPCLFNSSALPCPPPPLATAAANEAQRKLCFPFLSRLLGAGFGPTCIARAGRWTARTRRARWEAGWAGIGSQDLESAPALVVTPQTPQGWILMDPSCLLTPGKPQPTKWGGRGTPTGEDGAVITLVVCHDCCFCSWVSLVPPTGYWIEFSGDSGIFLDTDTIEIPFYTALLYGKAGCEVGLSLLLL